MLLCYRNLDYHTLFVKINLPYEVTIILYIFIRYVYPSFYKFYKYLRLNIKNTSVNWLILYALGDLLQIISLAFLTMAASCAAPPTHFLPLFIICHRNVRFTLTLSLLLFTLPQICINMFLPLLFFFQEFMLSSFMFLTLPQIITDVFVPFLHYQRNCCFYLLFSVRCF